MAKTRKQRGGVCPCALGSSADLLKMGGSRSSLLKMGGSRSSLLKMGGSRSSSRGGSSCAPLMRGGGSCAPLMRGGGADSGMFVKVGGYLSSLIGGGCGCSGSARSRLYGGYRQTKKNRKTLRRYKQGKSIGFTALASLKAKGLIKRSNGTYKISPKYSRK